MVELWILLGLAALNVALVLWLLVRPAPAPDQAALIAALAAGNERGHGRIDVVSAYIGGRA